MGALAYPAVRTESPWEPETPEEELPQDPGIPGHRSDEEKPPELEDEDEDASGSAAPPPDAVA